MSFDFSESGRSARELIPVPDVPLASIRSRSQAARKRGRVQALVACAAISVGVVGAGTGIGAKIVDGLRVWVSGGQAAIKLDSIVVIRHPTSPELRDTIAHATFPVVFPVGIPADSRVFMLTATPADRPRAIIVSYQTHTGSDGPGFVLLDPAAVDASSGGVQAASARFQAVYHWRAGGEVVLAIKKRLVAAEVERIKAAMAQSSPRESLAVVETMLAKVAVLGGPNRLELAERYAPGTGRSVLLDELQVRSIARGGNRGTPILDRRVFRASHVPYAHGDIDYRKLGPSRSKSVAVPANGVRAIAAAVRSAGGAACGCEVLFNQPNAATYWVWTIPMSGAQAGVKKYSVDARTLGVTPARS
jgi:hypothetical protein